MHKRITKIFAATTLALAMLVTPLATTAKPAEAAHHHCYRTILNAHYAGVCM